MSDKKYISMVIFNDTTAIRFLEICYTSASLPDSSYLHINRVLIFIFFSLPVGIAGGTRGQK